MIYTTEVPRFGSEKRSIITLGKFDGLHRGHQKLIRRVRALKEAQQETVVFTFDVSPLIRLGKTEQKFLLTNEERRMLAESMGVDYLVECPFTEQMMHMEPEVFVKEFLAERLRACAVVVGSDFRFGYQRKGTPQLLQKLGQIYDFSVEILEKEREGDREISSTYIREELAKGQMEKVNAMLGYPYFTKGEVIHGHQLGRTIGVPTINLMAPSHKEFPPYGVYVTKTTIGDTVYQGITNVGYKPTVGETFLGIETNLFDCSRDLYGMEAKVAFYHYLRPEKKFSTIEMLKKQLQLDEKAGREFFDF